MTTNPTPTVKAFMSYAWSSDAHVSWVLDLATRLASDGVEVVLDKWDLKVGHDAHPFMEKMVTDPSVTKVMMICDRTYQEKADGREGGVGKETTILTAEIYNMNEQDKYAAIITEHNENGKGYVPAYYGGRPYIDFADASQAEIKYQELLRWLYNKPQHVRPKLGSVPTFITDPDAVVTGTTSKFKAAESAIRTNAAQAGGYISDFGEAMVAEFREHKPIEIEGEPLDEAVLRAAERMRPALRLFHELVLAETRFGATNFDRILRIMEQVANLMYRPPEVRQWKECNFDAWRMIAYEGFLGLVAILLTEQKFDLVGRTLSHGYFIPNRERNGGAATITFRVFSQDVETMRFRKDRLNSRQIDLYSDLIAETYAVSFPALPRLIEADLFLFLRGQIVTDSMSWEQWWPRTLIHARGTVSEVFSRSESMAYFDAWAPKVFGKLSVAEFKAAIAKLSENSRGVFGIYGPSLASLTNSANVGTRA